jgi:hypothetical protein
MHIVQPPRRPIRGPEYLAATGWDWRELGLRAVTANFLSGDYIARLHRSTVIPAWRSIRTRASEGNLGFTPCAAKELLSLEAFATRRRVTKHTVLWCLIPDRGQSLREMLILIRAGLYPYNSGDMGFRACLEPYYSLSPHELDTAILEADPAWRGSSSWYETPLEHPHRTHGTPCPV